MAGHRAFCSRRPKVRMCQAEAVPPGRCTSSFLRFASRRWAGGKRCWYRYPGAPRVDPDPGVALSCGLYRGLVKPVHGAQLWRGTFLNKYAVTPRSRYGSSFDPVSWRPAKGASPVLTRAVLEGASIRLFD
jgi:hypothetical protein